MRRAKAATKAVIACIAALFPAAGRGAEPAPSVAALTVQDTAGGGGRIYVSMRFGAVMGPMRLDTGASTSRLTLAPWNRDWPVTARSASLGASGAAASCEDVEAKNVALVATQGNAVARGRYEVTRCAASDGGDLLGLDFFKGARLTLDIAHRQMTVFGEPAKHPKPLRRLGPDQSLAGIDVKLGGAPVVGLFDTGAELCAIDRTFVQKHKKLFTAVKEKGAARDAGGKDIAAQKVTIRKLDLGDGLVLKDVLALSYDFGALRAALGKDAPLVLGYNALTKVRWSLDLTKPETPTFGAEAAQ